MTADIGTAEGRAASLDGALSKLGGLDILVNNAGGVRAGRLEDIREDEIRTMVDVDLLAPILLTRAALPALRSSGDALVINVSSGIALLGAPFYTVYAAVKAGLARFGEALRRELAGEGIGVLTVYPTATDTPMMATSKANPPGGRESAADVAIEIAAAITTGKLEVVRGTPERIAQIRTNQTDPAAVDAVLQLSKDQMEQAVRHHNAL